MGVHVCVGVKKKNAWEAAQRGEQGVIELCEVPDTVAVTAALNVPLISHQSLLQSLEGDEKLLSIVQSPSLSTAWVQSNHPFRAWDMRWPERKFNAHDSKRGQAIVSIQCRMDVHNCRLYKIMYAIPWETKIDGNDNPH